jgi:hypothetical protein
VGQTAVIGGAVARTQGDHPTGDREFHLALEDVGDLLAVMGRPIVAREILAWLDDVDRGDGTALLQVSQARQPCWKLDHRFGVLGMARRVQASGRTGWYCRVVKPGVIAAGEILRLADRPCPDWPLTRLLRAFYVDRLERDALAGLIGLDLLSPSWRELAARRLERGAVEEWRPRLDGPGPPPGAD